MLKLLKKIILNIRKFIFIIKYAWELESEFGAKYCRVPDEKEREEFSRLAEAAWQRRLRVEKSRSSKMKKKTKPADKTTDRVRLKDDGQRGRAQRLDKVVVYTTDTILKSAGMALSGPSATETRHRDEG